MHGTCAADLRQTRCVPAQSSHTQQDVRLRRLLFTCHPFPAVPNALRWAARCQGSLPYAAFGRDPGCSPASSRLPQHHYQDRLPALPTSSLEYREVPLVSHVLTVPKRRDSKPLLHCVTPVQEMPHATAPFMPALLTRWCGARIRRSVIAIQ